MGQDEENRVKRLFNYPFFMQYTSPHGRFLQVGWAITQKLDGVYADWKDCTERFMIHGSSVEYSTIISLLALKMGKRLSSKPGAYMKAKIENHE